MGKEPLKNDPHLLLALTYNYSVSILERDPSQERDHNPLEQRLQSILRP